MGLVLAGLIIFGFKSAWLEGQGIFNEIDGFLAVHGIVFFAWYLLFLLQATLIRNKNIALHKRMGQLSVLLVIVIIVLGVQIMQRVYGNPNMSIAGLSPEGSMIFPFTDLLNFTIAYVLALTYRKDGEAHKRWMLLAGILMIGPATARTVIMNGLPEPMILLLELGLIIALMVYDFRTRGKPHWATGTALGIAILTNVAKFSVSETSFWHGFMAMLFA